MDNSANLAVAVVTVYGGSSTAEIASQIRAVLPTVVFSQIEIAELYWEASSQSPSLGRDKVEVYITIAGERTLQFMLNVKEGVENTLNTLFRVNSELTNLRFAVVVDRVSSLDKLLSIHGRSQVIRIEDTPHSLERAVRLWVVQREGGS